MPPQKVWPPPVEPDEPFEFDGLLKTLVCGSRRWRPQTRDTLVLQFRRAKKMDRRAAIKVVNNFCDRFQILPKQGARVWGPTIFALTVFCCISIASTSTLKTALKAVHAAPTCAAAHQIHAQYAPLVFGLFGLQLLVFAAMISFIEWMYWRAHQDAMVKLSR